MGSTRSMVELVLSHDFILNTTLVDIYCIFYRFNFIQVKVLHFKVILVLTKFQLLWLLYRQLALLFYIQ